MHSKFHKLHFDKDQIYRDVFFEFELRKNYFKRGAGQGQLLEPALNAV